MTITSVVMGPVEPGWFTYPRDGQRRWHYRFELSCGHALQVSLPRGAVPRRVRKSRAMGGYGSAEWAGRKIVCPPCGGHLPFMSDEITKAIARLGKPTEPPPEPPDAKKLLARKASLIAKRDEAVRIANAKQALIEAGAKRNAHVDDLEHYQDVAVRCSRKLEALEMELAKVQATEAREAFLELPAQDPSVVDQIMAAEREASEALLILPAEDGGPFCTGAEFVEAAQAAIEPRTDEEIRKIIIDVEGNDAD